LLLLALALSSSSPDISSSKSSSTCSRSGFIIAANAQPIEQIPLNTQTISAGVLIKNSSSAADRVAPAAVVSRYLPPNYQAGPGGRWHYFNYGDVRNSNPRNYCPRSCRTVSTRICDCQCVTRDSLNWYYMMRR
jgi:hypothetical protein